MSALLAPNQLSTNAGVIGTNIVLAIILLVALLFSSALFNATIEEHRVEFEGLTMRAMAPFHAFGRSLQGVGLASSSAAQAVLGPLLILLLTGFIYMFNSPGIGLNDRTLAYFLSLVIGFGVITYVYEGGEALLTRQRLGMPAGVRLFPIAPMIALCFVVLSRATGFEAPIMYGFVASSTLLVAAETERLEQRLTAFTILVPAIILLTLSLGAWGLLIPLRHMNDNSEWWSFIPSNAAALVFAGGIEGLLFAMIPMRFTDGSKIFRWYRLLWFPLFFVPAFIFAWAILNPEAQAFDSLLQGRVILALSLVGAYTALALSTWVYFALRSRSHRAHSVPGS